MVNISAREFTSQNRGINDETHSENPTKTPPPTEQRPQKSGEILKHSTDQTLFSFLKENETMVTTRHIRAQTVFYNPSANSQNTSVSARGKLRNPSSTRRCINDTTANRTRISNAAQVTPRIRNPRTGRMIRATASNIRSAERFRQEFSELLRARAATAIAHAARSFVARPCGPLFTFQEKSETFQTATTITGILH